MTFFRKLLGLREDKTFRLCLISTFIIGLLAHSYCYFNQFYSHDSILVYQNDINWQISLGRFLHPVYFQLRGNFYTPSLVGFLSLFFIALAAFLIVRLLEIRNPLSVTALCGILAVNETVTLLNATYIHDIDIYMLAFFLNMCAMYWIRRKKYGWLCAPVLFVAAMALYQSFFQTAVFLLMVMAIKDILDGKETKEVVFTGLRAVASMLVSLVIYYIAMNLVLKLCSIPIETGYNGVSQVGKFSGLQDILHAVYLTYFNMLYYFFRPLTFHDRIIELINIALIALGGFMLILAARRRKISRANWIILFAILALVPFGINLVCFLSQGIEHRLMSYSLFLIYAFVLYLENIHLSDTGLAAVSLEAATAGQVLRKLLIPCLILLTILCNSIYSSQTYLYKQLVYQNTMLTAERIIDRIEQVDDYEVGKTPVVFAGTLDESPYQGEYEGFTKFGDGLDTRYAVTVYWTYPVYFKQVLDYPINIQGEAVAETFRSKPEVKDMPVFPAPGSCRMVEGTMVIKLAD